MKLRDQLYLDIVLLYDRYGLSCGGIAKYLKKNHGIVVHRSTIHRWLNR